MFDYTLEQLQQADIKSDKISLTKTEEFDKKALLDVEKKRLKVWENKVKECKDKIKLLES